MPIHEKILAIQKEIEVEKTGVHPKYESKFFKDTDVTDAVRKELNARGVIVSTEVTSHEANTFFDANGRYRPSVFARIRFTFTDVSDGTSFSSEVAAEGAATGDDASSRKLFTQARKIVFLQVFQIGETNEKYDQDTNDEYEPVDNSPQPPPSQRAVLSEMVAEIADLIKDADSPVEAPMVAAVTERQAKAIIGPDATAREGKKDARVLEAVIKDLKAGLVE